MVDGCIANNFWTLRLHNRTATKAPRTKHQTPERHQTPNSNKSGNQGLELGIWRFSGAWCLVLGAFPRWYVTCFSASMRGSMCHLSRMLGLGFFLTLPAAQAEERALAMGGHECALLLTSF